MNFEKRRPQERGGGFALLGDKSFQGYYYSLAISEDVLIVKILSKQGHKEISSSSFFRAPAESHPTLNVKICLFYRSVHSFLFHRENFPGAVIFYPASVKISDCKSPA